MLPRFSAGIVLCRGPSSSIALGGTVLDYNVDPLDDQIIVEISLAQLNTVQHEASSELGSPWGYSHETWCVNRHHALFQCTTQEANLMRRGVNYRSTKGV